MRNQTTPQKRGNAAALSLAEVIVTIGVLGIISGIALSYFGGTLEASRSVVAREVAETLNLGLKKHAQVEYVFGLAANDDTSADEIAIVRSLQYRDPLDPAPGAPFVRPNWHPIGSDDDEEFRLQWNGMVFVVLAPGTSGTGIMVEFDASDYGENYIFPDGFKPIGD